MTPRAFLYLIPLLVFLALAALFFTSLGKDPSIVPSPLINKPAPEFSLPLLGSEQRVNPIQKYAGKAWMLNVWASWCVACRIEHSVFVEARNNNSSWTFVGLNYHDTAQDAQTWLNELGDPYTISVADVDGRVGIDWGVYGVPETFIIDAHGAIRYKHTGMVTKELMLGTLLPILAQLNKPLTELNTP